MISGNIFQTLSIPNQKSQGAEILREFLSHTMCHVSCVMCHVSHIICHMSRVTFHLSHVKIQIYFLSLQILQSGGDSRWRVCHQHGLPRLV